MLQKVIMHLLLIITLFNFNYLSSSEAAKCHPHDEAGLLAFKSGIKSDPAGFLNSWIPGTDCCSTWLGIRCDQPLNRVAALDLEADNSTEILSGTISPSLSKLEYLREIYLENLKKLSGPFPKFLFKLPRLEYFYIVNNKLSGKLPKNIGTRFSSKLIAFSIEGNKFSGPIPDSFGQLTSLSELKLGGNKFTGSIPYSIGNLINLTELSLDRNHLTGTIPDFFKGLTNLRIFNLSYNHLSGNIPGSIIATKSSLAGLEVGHNALSGKIDFLGTFKELTILDLSYNSFVDPFPKLDTISLRSVDLSYNNFHLGQIPAWTTSSLLSSLKLAKCGIKIKLDDWKPFFVGVFNYIDLSENEITGSPVQILNGAYALVGFYASGNKLKFNLENVQFAQTLKYLELSRNLIFGKVPKVVSGLDKLNVSYNHLCGQLPKTKFPASSFVGNDCLCGPPLPKCKA